MTTARLSVGQLDPSTSLIRINEVVAIVGLARPTIYKLMSQPENGFPLPVKLSDRIHELSSAAPFGKQLSHLLPLRDQAIERGPCGAVDLANA